MKRLIAFLSAFAFVAAAYAQAVPAREAGGLQASSGIDQLIASVPDGSAIVGGTAVVEGSTGNAGTSAATKLSRKQWKLFGKNLERALASGHEGLQTAAMRLLIQYEGHVSVGEDAVFDVMRLYRNHPDQRVRRMAVVTLGNMDSRWAIHFMERAARFEKSPIVRQTMLAVIAEYRAAKGAS